MIFQLRLFTLVVCLLFALSTKAQIVSDQGENVPAAAGSTESNNNAGGLEPEVPQDSGVDSAPAPGPGFVPDNPSLRPHGPSKPRFNRFNRWMKVLNEFFSQGNWLNGGPDNMMEYIGRTLTRLLDILMNREGIDEITTTELFGDMAPVARSRATAARTASGSDSQRNHLTISDILKMIPQDRLNLPADRFFQN